KISFQEKTKIHGGVLTEFKKKDILISKHTFRETMTKISYCNVSYSLFCGILWHRILFKSDFYTNFGLVV
ncbi:MAG: hypothetical protein RSB26_06975, partial [Lachnospiraceae bacterium]